MSRLHRRFLSLQLLLAGAVLLTGCPGGPGPQSTINPAQKAPGQANPPRPTRPSTAPALPVTERPAPLPTADPVGPVPQQPPPLPPLIGDDNGVKPGDPSLSGTVKMPSRVISDNGLGIISNNSSSLIGNNGGGVISDNGLGIIANNGGGLIGKVKYNVLLAAGTEGPLKNAHLYLTDRDEKFFVNRARNQVFSATTNDQGVYQFPSGDAGFPVNKDAIVNVLVGGTFRLTGYLVPSEGNNQLDVTLGSTVTTEYLRGEAYRSGKNLSAYSRPLFDKARRDTDAAIASGDIAALVPDPTATDPEAALLAFDLRMDHVVDLRNQYAIALSAVAKSNTLVRQISDTWKQLLGHRPVAVTTVLGNGEMPIVQDLNNYYASGFATGDHRDGVTTPGPRIPIGFNAGVAVSQRGDVFISAYTEAGYSGHLRWIKPNGTITSIWLPSYSLLLPGGLVVERQPVDDYTTQAPGTLLVTDVLQNRVFRVPIVDEPYYDGDGFPIYPTEIVAGEGQPYYELPPSQDYAYLQPDHPYYVDGPENYQPVSADSPLTSAWRLTDEGERTYANGDPVPSPARFAHLHAPADVEVDELGNIYISEPSSHRVRMIVGAAGDGQNFYGYRRPFDDDADGLIDRYDATPTPMKAGCMYTIAGNPAWDTVRTPNDGFGRWFGEYHLDGGAASDGVRGQLARLDQPFALAFHGGHLYLSDFDNQRVRRLPRQGGVIETVAGSPTGGQRNAGGLDYDFAPGTAGDGGPAQSAQLAYPRGLAFDASGRLYISDTDSGRLRVVGTDGQIQTAAGRLHALGGKPTDNVTDGEALHWADLYDTQFIAVDTYGNVLLNDRRHRRLRKVWRQWE